MHKRLTYELTTGQATSCPTCAEAWRTDKVGTPFCVAGSPGEKLLTGAASSESKNPRSVFTDPGCRSERTAELVVAPGYCTAGVSAWALRAKASEEVLQVPEKLLTVSVPASWSLLKGGGGGGGAGMALA